MVSLRGKETEMKSKKSDGGAVSRRSFLQQAGLTATATGAAATVLAAGAPTSARAGSPKAQPSAGYRETEHVRRVYALSRF